MKNFSRLRARLIFPLMTAVSLAWFLFRVIPKPVRATYPCQQAAFPLLSALVVWLLGLKAGALAWAGARRKTLARKIRLGLITSSAIAGIVFAGWLALFVARALAAWTPAEGPNAPM